MRTQEEFIHDLRASAKTVVFVAEALRGKGYPVTLLPNEESPSKEERMSFTDDGDLMLGMAVEVKQSSYSFTSPEDFPYDDVIVMAKHAWDGKTPSPHSVVMVNKEKTHAVVTKADSKPHWKVKTLPDKRYPEDPHQQFYLIPKEKCYWWKF